MAYAITNGTRLFKRTEYEVERVEREALFGLIRWTEIVKRNARGVSIVVESGIPIKEIILNGKVIKIGDK